jgi:hypothetical protein
LLLRLFNTFHGKSPKKDAEKGKGAGNTHFFHQLVEASKTVKHDFWLAGFGAISY